MSGITVVLTTTGHILSMDDPGSIVSRVRESDIPVCIAEIFISMSSLGGMLEREEVAMAEICKGMAKTVHVDSGNRYVFIGEDPRDDTTALIEYRGQINRDCENDFFARWDLLNCLIMEFNVHGASGPVFSVIGLWEKGRWSSLEVISSPKMTVLRLPGSN